MSLQVWLPLNGDLNNQGLSNIVFTNTGVNIDDNGKIGKCYYFNADQYIKESTYDWTNFNTSEFSLCCWYKEPSPVASGNSQIICIGTSSGWNNIRIGLLRRTSNGYPMFSVSNGSTAIQYNFTASTFTLDTWNHIAVTYNNGELKMYLNGALNKTSTTTIIPVLNGSQHLGIGAASNGAEKLTGFLNDVRIYDHCLSAKEVEEISKGLILHYKLNSTYINENLMPESLEMKLGSANPSTGTWRTAGSNNMTRSRVAIIDTPDGNGYGFQNSGIQTANDGSCYGIDSFPMEPNTIYTISMWARITSGTEGYAGFNIYSSTLIKGSHSKVDKNYSVTTLPTNGDWVKCWYIFKTNSSTTRNIYIGITTGSTSVTTQMANVHLEKGAINYNIIYDSSGYQNNGDQFSSLIISNTPKYNSGIQLFGTTVDNSSNTKIGAAYIRGFLNLTTPSALTVTWWGKNTSYGRGGIFQTSVNSDPSECTDYNTTAIANWDSTFRIYNGSTAVNFFNSFVKDDTWHYHTITFDGNTAKYYLDGNQKVNSALTGTLPTFNGFCLGLGKAGGVYRQIKESISDFRIYCTALTEKQIKELYDTSAAIDKSGNIYAREVIE